GGGGGGGGGRGGRGGGGGRRDMRRGVVPKPAGIANVWRDLSHRAVGLLEAPRRWYGGLDGGAPGSGAVARRERSRGSLRRLRRRRQRPARRPCGHRPWTPRPPPPPPPLAPPPPRPD